jgi:hypothetical protein
MFGLALIQSKVQVNDTWLDYFIIAVYFVEHEGSCLRSGRS